MRIMMIIRLIIKIVVKISLLNLASQLGRKISKLSFSESEYFLAIKVNGQNNLNISKTIPSAKISPIPIQV